MLGAASATSEVHHFIVSFFFGGINKTESCCGRGFGEPSDEVVAH